MPGIDDIIEQVLAAARGRLERGVETSRAYGDEPIIMRGSQLASYQPEPIRQMRALARHPEARSWTDARLFVEQARLMSGYEDDFPSSEPLLSYFPTYAAMSNRQLRSYFTWRTHVRAGRVEKTSTSYAYVYLYELINGVGAEPGEGAFRAIEAFWQAYRKFDSGLDRYVRAWLVDYAVYHDLDPALALPYVDVEHDRAVAVLAEAERRALELAAPRSRRQGPGDLPVPEGEATRLFDALEELSTYRLAHARLYHERPEELRDVTYLVFGRLARYYRSNRTQGLTESLFGARREMPHLMFASAVFYPGERHPDATYDLAGTRRYACRGGLWTCDALHDGGARSSKLGQVLRAVDRQLRVALDYPHQLKERGDPKYLVSLVDRAIGDYLSWRRAHAPVRVEIDLSKLAGIRAGAAQTREALLVDEEREDEKDLAPAPAASGAASGPAPATAPGPSDPAAGVGLLPEERALLAALLDAKEAPAGTDLLVDSINERLFDLVGDTVLEFDDSGRPTIVEDYVDEVRSVLG